MSAVEIMERLESGEYDTEVILKAGEASRPHPIRGSLRELVWESRTMQRLLNTHVRPDGLYLDIVDRAPIPTALSDLGGRISYVNQAFCDFIGYERDELIGMTVGQLSAPDDHSQERQRGNQALSGRTNGFQMEKRYLHKSGEDRVGLLSISILKDVEGVPTSVMAQIADLSEVKRMQEELIQSQSLAAVGRLAQEITHDLKNILMALQGTLDLVQLRSDVLEPDELELIEGGIGVCESGHLLVRSLLDLQASPQLNPLDLREWLPTQIATLSRFVDPFPLTYEVNTRGLILADPHSLERALMNLCVNAKQALTRQPDHQRRAQGIRISLSEASSEHQSLINSSGVALSVTDAGEGIPASLLAQISEPYFTTRAGEGGYGLGLAVVWSFCHHHGGTLTVTSEEGLGSVFTLVLPHAEVSESPAATPPETPPDTR